METVKTEITYNGTTGVLHDTPTTKEFNSPGYKWKFNKQSGFFVRVGKTLTDDPDPMMGLPELADIEVTTKCGGVNGKLCEFCYKANSPKGENMSFQTFKAVLDKLPDTITQVAFGIDSRAQSNPALFAMMEHCRNVGIVPNVTVSDIDDVTAKRLASVCGAVAVSRYEDRDVCYDSVARLTSCGLEQVNIHVMASSETEPIIWQTLQDRLVDDRLSRLNAIVMLALKRKGRGVRFNRLPDKSFEKMVRFAIKYGIGLGFDSCAASRFLHVAKKVYPGKYEFYRTVAESCESGIFSVYVNVHGRMFPCSFMEGELGWRDGIDIPGCDDFLRDVWFGKRLMRWKHRLLATVDEHDCRNCPCFEV